MPEMLQLSGRTFTVGRRADKTCDTIAMTGLRRLHDTVHLAGVRCDGSAHDGCEAGCLIFWKEAWLEPASIGAHGGDEVGQPDVPEVLTKATRAAQGGEDTGQERYRCQATELFRASALLPWWDVRQLCPRSPHGQCRSRCG